MPFFVNPMYQGDFNQNYPNVNSMQNWDIRNLEKKMDTLEREMNILKNRIIRLESTNNNYTSNYKANSYNMM